MLCCSQQQNNIRFRQATSQYNLFITMGRSSGKKIENKKSETKKQSSLTKQKLVDFLIRSAEVQRKLEIVKEMLAEQDLFTPASLFHRLDTARKGHIVERDLESFLKDQGIELRGCDLKMLFGRVNANKNQPAVYLRDFQNFILPNQNPRLRYFTMRRPTLIPPPRQPLNEKIEWITTKLFNQIVQQYSKLMELHQTLISSFDFDANQIFKLLSNNGEFVTGEDLLAFFAESGREISREEVGCLLRVVDKRGEGQLYIGDFKHFLATLGLKKEHQIFDELSPIPALKDSQKKVVKDRDSTLKERYKDNKSYVKGMDEQGHHVLGYSKYTDPQRTAGWLSNSRNGH